MTKTEKQKIDHILFLVCHIKNSPVLRRNIKKRTDWLQTLIEELNSFGK